MAMRLSRRKITSYVAEQLAAGTKQVIKQLAAFLIDNRRTKELELIVRDVEYELVRRGVVLARITSAHELTTATQTAINALIKDQTGAKTIQLQQFIDPGVLGGVKIDIPGQQIDTTIVRRLTTLRTNVKK
jgi:F-type H+-transporting ATPase subunit delta